MAKRKIWATRKVPTQGSDDIAERVPVADLETFFKNGKSDDLTFPVVIRDGAVETTIEEVPAEPTPDQLLDDYMAALHNYDEAVRERLRAKAALERYPGRPSIKRAIVHKLREVAAVGRLEDTVAEQARVLLERAKSEFPKDQTPTVRTVENQIRAEFRRLKQPTK